MIINGGHVARGLRRRPGALIITIIMIMKVRITVVVVIIIMIIIVVIVIMIVIMIVIIMMIMIIRIAPCSAASGTASAPPSATRSSGSRPIFVKYAIYIYICMYIEREIYTYIGIYKDI